MKIELKQGYVALLKEESGEVVATFKPSVYANSDMMCAVALHFDVPMVGLNTDRDFKQPYDNDEPYDFVLYRSNANDEDEYVTLRMTYVPIF